MISDPEHRVRQEKKFLVPESPGSPLPTPEKAGPEPTPNPGKVWTELGSGSGLYFLSFIFSDLKQGYINYFGPFDFL